MAATSRKAAGAVEPQTLWMWLNLHLGRISRLSSWHSTRNDASEPVNWSSQARPGVVSRKGSPQRTRQCERITQVQHALRLLSA